MNITWEFTLYKAIIDYKNNINFFKWLINFFGNPSQAKTMSIFDHIERQHWFVSVWMCHIVCIGCWCLKSFGTCLVGLNGMTKE